MDIEKAYRLGRAKMDEHGLQTWDLMFDSARSRFGCCFHHKKLITLSKCLTELNVEAHVLDTILHEIAHALVKDGHSKKWKQKALEIGCNGKRCYSDEVVQPASNYSATCSRCGFTYYRTRKTKSSTRYYVCTPCYRKDKVKVRLEFTRPVIQAGMTKAIAS
jgi:predicted SprT family Zn-dependent metalloprotease